MKLCCEGAGESSAAEEFFEQELLSRLISFYRMAQELQRVTCDEERDSPRKGIEEEDGQSGKGEGNPCKMQDEVEPMSVSLGPFQIDII